MKRFFLFIPLFCLFSVSFVSAEPYLTNNVRVYSDNNAYYANIAKSSDNVTELTVFRADRSLEVWSSWLDWGKDYSGYISNDGAVFIAVNSVYSENNNLITVYHQGKQESYTVKSIPMNREFLRSINGKYVWIDVDSARVRFVYDSTGAAVSFEVERIDRKVISLKLK